MKVEPIYTARAKRSNVANRAVAIHCSDHRFQDAFREFLTEGLGLISYALLAIPGGAHFCSLEQLQPKFAKVGFQSVSFLIKRTGARRIILVGHDDCLFFKEHLQFFFPEPDLRQKQLASLRSAPKMLRERFGGAAIDIYFADANPDGHIQFLNIE